MTTIPHACVMLQEVRNDGSGAEIYVPLIVVRVLRIVFVPLLLDGMMLIGERHESNV